MRKIAIINQKGGVGKTTTTVNLAAALALAGCRVCVIDLDPQAHASTHLGVELDGTLPSLYDVLVSGRPMAAVRRDVGANLTLIPADINLAAAEVELAGVVGREVILREALTGMIEGDGQPASQANAYDYLLMDCGPSLGVLTINALAAADEVFIPLQPHFLALHGLSKLLETTALVSRRINPQLVVTGVVVCLYDAATKLAQEVVADLHAFLARSRGTSVPWAAAKVFETKIRRNIKLAECPSFGQNIFAYAPKSTGAADYAALAMEVMGDAAPLRVETARLVVETPPGHAATRQTTLQPVV
ncbi:MAG: AAA family ATPase [Gemmataceae bacterium]|nr:AAA family ATPase [Gemmata sp.]MDW8197711.1 AAA family ATPase [Gemmataceae bacterium]